MGSSHSACGSSEVRSQPSVVRCAMPSIQRTVSRCGSPRLDPWPSLTHIQNMTGWSPINARSFENVAPPRRARRRQRPVPMPDRGSFNAAKVVGQQFGKSHPVWTTGGRGVLRGNSALEPPVAREQNQQHHCEHIVSQRWPGPGPGWSSGSRLSIPVFACGVRLASLLDHRSLVARGRVTGVSVPSSSGRPRRCRQPHLSRCAEPQAVTGRGGTAAPGMCHVKFDEEFGRSTVHRRRRQHRIRGPLNTDELMVVGQLT